MTDTVDLQPLTSDASVKDVALEPQPVKDFGTRSLCIVDDDEGNITDQLVIYDVSFGDASSADLIKVKPIDGEDVMEVKKEHTKVHCFLICENRINNYPHFYRF